MASTFGQVVHRSPLLKISSSTGLTAEGFDDWDREKIDFTTWHDNIKWYRGRRPIKRISTEEVTRWIEGIISVQWTDEIVT